MSNKEKFIEIEDFILEETEIKTSMIIDPKTKLSDFANLKIPLIDPSISIEIRHIAGNIKSNLRSLKAILND